MRYKIGLDGKEYIFANYHDAYCAFKNLYYFHKFTNISPKESCTLGQTLPLRKDWEEIKPKVKKFLKRMETDKTFIANANYLCEDYCRDMEIKRKKIFEEENEETKFILKKINSNKQKHIFAVAEYMKENAYKYNLNADEMFVVGLLHDVGYIYGRYHHELKGSELFDMMGLDSFYINAIKYHGTKPEDVPIVYMNNALKLLYEADMSIDAKGNNVGFEKRLYDIALRYGKDSIAYETALAEVEFVKKKGEK